MLVQAKPGARCPMEGNPRQYIEAGAPVEVADSAYYRRLLADGSLVVVSEIDCNRKRRDRSPSDPKCGAVGDRALHTNKEE